MELVEEDVERCWNFNWKDCHRRAGGRCGGLSAGGLRNAAARPRTRSSPQVLTRTTLRGSAVMGGRKVGIKQRQRQQRRVVRSEGRPDDATMMQ
ncbi:hypothetical protein O3P69_007054 [Scylla paramamosain]|uniref:Uncharacterized protein n=1 Tax=Scylla paramamosain TaxID=85552 RepID=A0AAW0V3M1_SCYPA